MKKVIFLISLFLINLTIKAQRPSPVSGVITEGVGIYAGLKKIPPPCDTCVGNFFVSPENDFSGMAIKWLTLDNKLLNANDRRNGLRNTLNLLNKTYPTINIAQKGLAPLLQTYPEGISGIPAGAIETCFQKNYRDGKLVAGTTSQNMWHLPAFNELKLIWTHNYFNKTAFGDEFKTATYWSSTEFSAVTALTSDFNYSGAIINSFKAAAYQVRCIRQHVPPAAIIGQSFGGGLVFHIDSTEQHGYVCTATDYPEALPWGTNNQTITGANGTSLGTGISNTKAIVSALGPGKYAAQVCNELVLNGHNDWFLPSQDEANLMYTNLNSIGIGGFGAYYWTSTEDSATFGWYSYFGTDSFYTNFKTNTNKVRCIRQF